MKKLFICNTLDKSTYSSANLYYVFNDFDFKIKSKSLLNNSYLLNDLALKYAKKYSKFIFSKLKYFNDLGLIHNDDLSLYTISTFSNKRTESFKTYDFVIHIKTIDKLITLNNISCIVIKGFSTNETKVLYNYFKKTNIKIVTKNIKSSIYKFDFLFIRNVNFFFSALIKKLILSFLSISNFDLKRYNLFISRFPLHFNSNKIKELKYYDLYNNSNSSYLISVISDGFHQNLNLKDYIKYLKVLKKNRAKKNFILIDNFLSVFDIIKSFFDSIKIQNKIIKLKNKKYLYDGIDLSSILMPEFNRSILHLPRIIMYEKSYINAITESNPKSIHYHLFEYSLGRFITYITEKYFKNIETISYQHGPVSKRKLVNCLAENEGSINLKDFKNKVPIPKKILCEDKQSYNAYKFFGYSNVSVLKKIPRLYYLENIKRLPVKNTILFACGLHDAQILYDYVFKSKLLKNNKIYFKIHPRSNFKLNSEIQNHNFIIADKSIKYYLSFINEVYCTYSSVGNESVKLKISTNLILSKYNICQSSLLEVKSKYLNIIYE